MDNIVLPLGSFINMLAVIGGSLAGLVLHGKFPERYRRIAFQAIGLCTLLIGAQMAFKAEDILILIISMLTGAWLGEWARLDERLRTLGDYLKAKTKSKAEYFTDGLVTAFLLYCAGSLTILGALEEGLNEDRSLLYTKSVLDGFTSIVLASSYGVGVLVSALPLFVFQGALTLSAGFMEPLLPEQVINQISAAGGIMILGLGLNLLEIKDIKVTNMLPALVIIVGLSHLILR
ncbi:DUF554 domain-containing protein [Roseivirga sp. BDSF3-8]|uniref:DUF554 domain-containing protein n=1 Tax=Roseivirga sp. BDSF3-8 TaxID=3241598 RepID=UPI003531A936